MCFGVGGGASVKLNGGRAVKAAPFPCISAKVNRKYSTHKALIGSVKLNNAQVKIMLMRHLTRKKINTAMSAFT